MVLKFLNSRKTGKVKKSKSYTTIEEIPVRIFYQILATGDLSPLRADQKNEKEIWSKICEDYYIASNKKSYDALLNKIKKREMLRNKIATCYAAMVLKQLNCESDEIDITLKLFGYSTNITAEDLSRRLQRESSYLKLLESKDNEEKTAEVVNFWRMVSQYEDAVGRQIDVEKVSLARWIEMLKVLKKNV